MLNLLTHLRLVSISIGEINQCCMILKPNWLEPEIEQNVILKFSLIISLEYIKDTEIEAPVPASVFHHCRLVFNNCLLT